jgi:predicted outer membrane repeat protein
MEAKNCEMSYNVGSGYGAVGFFDGYVTLDNCKVIGNKCNSGDSSSAGATFYVRVGGFTATDSEFRDNVNTQNGIVRNWTKVTIDKCIFENNYAGNYGGAIVSWGDTEITDSTFTGNSSNNTGAVYARGSYAKITNSTFDGNSSEAGNGAVLITEKAEIVGCTFTNNVAKKGDGGALYIAPANPNDVLVKDCTFDTNHADKGWGGGLRVSGYSKFKITNTKVTNNTADGAGGLLVYLNTSNNLVGKGVIESCEVSGNTATEGGGIYVYRCATTIVDSTIESNHVTENGGGLYFVGNDTKDDADKNYLFNVSIYGNTADLSGGGAYMREDTQVNFEGCVISSNVAGKDGGGVFTKLLENLTTDRVSFRNNSAATTYGGALPVDAAILHAANILTTNYTVPFNHAYNNADINYEHEDNGEGGGGGEEEGGGGETGGGGTVVTGSVETVTLAANVPESDEAVLAEAGDVPLSTVDSVEVPREVGAGGAWALVNLILMGLAIVMMLAILLSYYFGRKEELEDDQKLNKHGIARLFSIPLAIISLIVFFLTEDMSLRMVMTDRFTLLMAAFVVVQIIIAIISRKKVVTVQGSERGDAI